MKNANNSLNNKKYYPSQILIYTRPWEKRLHIEIGKSLQEKFKVPLIFITFFWETYIFIIEKGLNCIYLPKELNSAVFENILEEKLQETERKFYRTYGVTINMMLGSERFLPKENNEIDIFLKKHFIVLNRLIKEKTLSISSMYDHFIYWLAGNLANIKGGAHFAFVNCGVPNKRIIALKTPWKTWKSTIIDDNGLHLSLPEIRKTLDEPIENRIDYMKPINYIPINYIKPRNIPLLLNRIMYHFKKIKMYSIDLKEKSYFATKGYPWNNFTNNYKKNINLKKNNNLIDIKNEDSLPSNFIYISLHMEPEATILMYSPWLYNQIELVRLVSLAAPIDIKILVKENPKMIGVRDTNYLKKIRSIPGVLLVSANYPPIELIKKSICTISLVGTACLEAAILGKHSFVIGRPPFIIAKPSMAINSGKELFDKISKIIRERVKSKPIKKHNWELWLKSSFKATAIPIFDQGKREMQIDYSTTNSQAYVRYILSCINIK